jgi:hypothetical protein
MQKRPILSVFGNSSIQRVTFNMAGVSLNSSILESKTLPIDGIDKKKDE